MACRTPALLGRLLVACAGLAVGGNALAQTDVIVGDLYQIDNTYTTVSGGLRAYAVGTISCNIGPQRLTWIDEGTSTIYPVISQNLYKLDNGRFVQLGQAWLKHGFYALNGTVCGSCPVGSSPPGDYLMPQCSDPYSASLNGTQSGLGPKWEVNPATGVFPAAALVGTSTNIVAQHRGRLLVPTAELTTAGSERYFVSSIYIHPEDATFGTDNNNQSYRRVTVSPSTLNLTLADTTRRESPAIFAWRDYGNAGSVDNSVVLSPMDVAGDGRFWVGSKVVNLGGGNFRFEYAVQNLNSHRGGSSFSVPLPAGVTPTNIGFRDVAYHSGEPQTGADWTPSVSAGAITWTMPDVFPPNVGTTRPSNDERENVLRWDTIYNFWFEASVAGGTPANATLGLFQAGSPASVQGAVWAPTLTAPAPFNDLCSGATAVSTGSTIVSNLGATTDGPTECTNANYSQIGSDVWFTWTSGPCNSGTTTISICDANFDTKLAVYAGSGCPTSPGTALACNDDSAGCGTNGLGSSVTFATTPNTGYRIRLGGYQGATGSGTLVINSSTPALNDTCATGTWAEDGVTYSGSTVCAANEGTAGTCSASGNDVWFTYRPNTSATVVLSTCGSAFDTVLNVYNSCGGTQITCNDNHGQGTAFCTATNASRVSLAMNAGQTYYIRLSGRSNASGNYQFRVTGGGGTVPPSNDDCNNRAGLGTGITNFSTLGAVTDGPLDPVAGQVHNDIWYNFPAQCTGTMTVTTCGTTSFDSKLAVYSGATCVDLPSRLLGWSDNDACNANAASVTVPVTQGQSYTIRVGSAVATGRGNGTFTVTCNPGPTCDDIDFNNDGVFPDDQDVSDFVFVLGGGFCAACNDIDFNNDGVFPDDADVTQFLFVLGGGNC